MASGKMPTGSKLTVKKVATVIPKPAVVKPNVMPAKTVVKVGVMPPNHRK